MLLEIFLKPRCTTSTATLTHQPCDPAREGNLVGLTQSALHKSTLAVSLYALRITDRLSIIQLSIFHGVDLPLTALSLSMWILSSFLKPGTVLFPLVSESHISKLIHTRLFGITLPGIARSAGKTQGVHGQSCR